MKILLSEFTFLLNEKLGIFILIVLKSKDSYKGDKVLFSIEIFCI
jgi:hypothetical protein